jgi:hypothetical protein
MIRVKSGVTPRNLIHRRGRGKRRPGARPRRDDHVRHGRKHKVGSKHYIGQALDFRLLGAQTDTFRQALARRLGPAYQVLLEVDHVHVEYDPKP